MFITRRLMKAQCNFSVMHLWKLLDINGASYCILFTITLCINKIILSSFNFTYPTVLQGWYTLTTFMMMFLLKSSNKEKFKESVHAPGITIFAPHLLLHVLQLVIGSKALSLLPVPVFLCGINSCDALISLILKANKRLRHILAGTIIVISGLLVLWKYNEFAKIGASMWFLAYVLLFSADSLYCTLIDLKVNRFSKLFYINLLSVIALLSVSIISGEVHSALEFCWKREPPFFACLLISGICVGMTQLLTVSLHHKKLTHSIATTLAAFFAHVVIFEESLQRTLFHIILINLSSNFLFSLDISTLDYNKLELDIV